MFYSCQNSPTWRPNLLLLLAAVSKLYNNSSSLAFSIAVSWRICEYEISCGYRDPELANKFYFSIFIKPINLVTSNNYNS